MLRSLVGSEMCIRDRVRGAVQIWNTAGVAGFWRGVVPALVSNVPFSGINLAAFMGTKQAYKEWAHLGALEAPPIWVCLGLSGVSTMSAQLVAYPLYNVKTNMQASNQASAFACAQGIVADGGGCDVRCVRAFQELAQAPVTVESCRYHSYS
eukprot:TRINITY_DN38738_c0_g1_i1.p1 TRINITY_DN38738_c0_g1~~TRINITY_DN38738_c0_g1_i1.p1  ORF type:complete len:152 (-),score=23.39 TRINITY_DN38738_c0_g1_i1:440-895(-)